MRNIRNFVYRAKDAIDYCLATIISPSTERYLYEAYLDGEMSNRQEKEFEQVSSDALTVFIAVGVIMFALIIIFLGKLAW